MDDRIHAPAAFSDATTAVARPLLEQGFAGPLRLYSPGACARLLDRFERRGPSSRPAWPKGMAVVSEAFHEVATDPRIIDLIRPVLGDDIILWGAQLIRKAGNEVHPFHTDAESAAPEGGFVSVWIGLENTGPSAGLKFVPGSHRYGAPIQEANARLGVARRDSTGENVLAAARLYETDPVVVQPEVYDGAALFFDGRVWHGSHNQGSTATRTALLLQYAQASRPVRIPLSVEWPLRFEAERLPPVLVVSGRAPAGVNAVALPPGRLVPNDIHPLPPLPIEAVLPWAALPHFDGPLPDIARIESHSSVLAPGASPHPLHSHADEELLVVVAGEAELAMADDGAGTNIRRERMGPGDFAWYPAHRFHTITNNSPAPVLYTMFKWLGPKASTARVRKADFFHAGEQLRRQPGTGAPQAGIFDTPTRWLSRLHAHVTVMPEGTGYDAHADSHHVAIVLIEGMVQTLGRTVAAPAVLFHPAGRQHGLRALGPGPARYVVFEFEGRAPPAGRGRALKTRLKDLLRPWLGPPVRRLRRALGRSR